MEKHRLQHHTNRITPQDTSQACTICPVCAVWHSNGYWQPVFLRGSKTGLWLPSLKFERIWNFPEAVIEGWLNLTVRWGHRLHLPDSSLLHHFSCYSVSVIICWSQTNPCLVRQYYQAGELIFSDPPSLCWFGIRWVYSHCHSAAAWFFKNIHHLYIILMRTTWVPMSNDLVSWRRLKNP